MRCIVKLFYWYLISIHHWPICLMMTHPLPLAGKFPIKTLVTRYVLVIPWPSVVLGIYTSSPWYK